MLKATSILLRYAAASLLCLLALNSIAMSQRPTIEQLDAYREKLRPLLDAIRQVESGDNDDAVGDDGKAIGAYQIWSAYWSDAVEWVPDIAGTYEGCRARWYAERVMVAYWHRYCREALRKGDYQTLARVHNGGPRGAGKKATLPYWEKVQKVL